MTGISVINPGCVILSLKKTIERIIKASPINDKGSLTNLGKYTLFFKITVHKIPEINSQALVGSKKKDPELPSFDSISAKTKLTIKTNNNRGRINFLKYLKPIKIKIGKIM